MGDRYTKKDVANAFKRLAKFYGKSTECWRKVGKRWQSIPGTWRVDYNAIYGGAVIEEIVSEGGAISHPFGSMRKSPREFVDWVNGIIRGVEYYQDPNRLVRDIMR